MTNDELIELMSAWTDYGRCISCAKHGKKCCVRELARQMNITLIEERGGIVVK